MQSNSQGGSHNFWNSLSYKWHSNYWEVDLFVTNTWLKCGFELCNLHTWLYCFAYDKHQYLLNLVSSPLALLHDLECSHFWYSEKTTTKTKQTPPSSQINKPTNNKKPHNSPAPKTMPIFLIKSCFNRWFYKFKFISLLSKQAIQNHSNFTNDGINFSFCV